MAAVLVQVQVVVQVQDRVFKYMYIKRLTDKNGGIRWPSYCAILASVYMYIDRVDQQQRPLTRSTNNAIQNDQFHMLLLLLLLIILLIGAINVQGRPMSWTRTTTDQQHADDLGDTLSSVRFQLQSQEIEENQRGINKVAV